MLNRQISAFLALSLIVLLSVTMCILIITLMIIPNSSRGVVEVDDDSETATHEISDKKIENREQMDYSSPETSSRILFIVGLVLACGLFVVLIVIIVVVCVWSRKSQGYIVGDEPVSRKSTIVAGNEEYQLTHHSYNKNKLPEERHNGKDSIRGISKKDTEKHPSLVPLPYPPLKTVAVSSQVNCTDLTDSIEKANLYHAIKRSNEFEKTQVVQPQNYGSLSRSHLLSSVDEDGYHIDNFGLEFDEDTSKEDSFPAFTEAKSPSVNASGSSAQASVQTFEEIREELHGKPQSTPLPLPSPETEINNKTHPLERQLSKQDSFLGLPPFKAFDKYLTLVRVDSTTSLESCSLEETKNWESIEEEDEDREKIDKIEEEEEEKNK